MISTTSGMHLILLFGPCICKRLLEKIIVNAVRIFSLQEASEEHVCNRFSETNSCQSKPNLGQARLSTKARNPGMDGGDAIMRRPLGKIYTHYDLLVDRSGGGRWN